MPRTRLKICGITRTDDAITALEDGADFIGFNFVGGPRQISMDHAMSIWDFTAHARGLNPNCVALCHASSAGGTSASKGITAANWRDVVRTFVHVLQIYGPGFESLNSAADLKLSWWMVRAMHSRAVFAEIQIHVAQLKSKPAALLLDTASKTALGGTGQSFNWNWIAEARAAGELEGLPPLVLAGGLTPENVAEAIRIAQPYAVDVSSGVEVRGQPGIKDPIKMRDFIQAVQGAR